MQASDGEPTTYLYNLRAITNHPDGAHTRFNMLHRAELDRATALGKEIEEAERDMSASDTTDMRRASLETKSEKMQAELGDLRKKLDASKAKVLAEVKASQGAGRTRLVALSATPFAYEKTIDWANGYLFDYNEGQGSDRENGRGYNAGSNKDRYMMQHFGYSMRYNKLTQPDAKVDRGLMQRQWNANLKKSGALSGRMLDVIPDYDRRFILVESAIGNRIDEALDWISEQRQSEKGQGPYSELSDAINEQFKYLQKRYLLEAIKATEVIPIVKQHLAMGRKVVVFHDYKKGGGFNPFRVNTAGKSDMAAAVREFEAKFKDLVNAPLGSMPSPIEVFSRELPQTLLINGDEKQADLLKRYKSFQDDANGPQVMLVQSAKNKGWSGHDTTGKHQRVLINLGQPTAPTLAIQQEGRIYRTGQASDAIMRYMNTGTNWERWTFANTIAGRASTAENLGMGEMARALKDSFIQSFEESDAYPPGHENEGKGGKERDKAANDAITEYDRAKTFYFGQQKKNSKTKAQEGADYFATPEPIGLKMAQWLDARGGEDVLEPSAGHGAIARWIPDNTSRTAIEPSLTLRSRMAMVMNPTEDRIIDGTFEDHHVGNKYDGIVMNPPFGSGGKTAIDHLAKAATHLRDGGRIVALIPTGPAADKKFDKWFYDKSERQVKAVMETVALGKIYKGDTVILKANGQKATVLRANDTAGLLVHFAGHSAGTNTLAYPNMISAVEPTGKRTESFNAAEGLQLVANIKLPQVAFERAGTSVATRIVVLEKGGANVVQRDRDYSDITDVKELFDKLEHLDFAARTKPVEAAPVEAPKAEKPASAPKPAKASANAGDEVSINGKKYEIQIYITNAGKEKRGIWMDSKAEASKYSARTFTHSSNKGKWFVDEYWFPKDSEIIKPETGANPSRLQQSHINNGDSNAEETAKVQAGIEGKSLIDAARFIAQTGTPAQAEIAKQVISKLERLQASGVELKLIVAHRGDQVPAQMGKSRGYTESGFDSKGRDITVWVAGADVIGRVGTDYETVLHELVHAATMGVVHYGRNNPRSLAGKHVRDLSEVTSAISSHIIGRFNQADNGKTELTEFEKDMRTGGNNAFRGIDEVLSWALTSPQAQSYLEGIPYKNQNLWTRLVQAIRTLLGLSPKADTALSEVLRVAENLIASDLNDHAQQAFWHKRGIGMNTIQAVGSTVLPKKSNTKIVGQTTRQYTPEQMATFGHVGRQVTVPTLKERAQAMTKDMGKKLAQGIADQFAPVKEISKDAYALLRLSKGASGALDTFLNGGKLKLTNGVYDFDETQKGGVIDKLLKPLQGEHHDFLWWVAANRAETLMAEDRENLFTSADIAALKTLTDGNTAFDYTIQNGVRRGQVTRNRAEIYKDSQATLQAFNKNALDMAEQSGLIDPESRKVWESEFYVPFYRVADTTEGGIMGMNVKSGVVRQQAFKHLKGGKQALNSDLLDNVLMNWAHLLDASAKNRAAKATIEAAENMGLAAGGDQNTLKQIASSIGNRNGVVWFMDEGVKRYSLIDDPYLMTALTSLEYAGMRSPVMTAMGAFKNMLTIGVTASPFFKIRNLIRDSVQVIGTGNISYNPAKNVAEGWKLTNPKNDEYFRLLASGGTIHFGTMLEGSEAKRVQALVESGVDAGTILSDEHKVKAFYRKYIEPGITAYNELGNRSESVNRAALYNQLIKQGVSHADAALQARDLMDFSMQGSFTTIRFLTQVVPFMNARIQGLYKLGRAAKEDPARFRTVIGATALLSLGLLAAYSDDDDWKRRTDADRNNYWWFKFGGTAFRIPKPFEIGAIATLAERSFELAFEKEMTNERFRNQVMALLGDNLSMNPIPQIVKPVLDVYANVNSFTGTPIESMGMERLKSEYRFNDKTSMAARGISTAANAAAGLIGKDAPSPVKIDHLLQGYFGWLGTFVVQAGDLVARGASNQPTQASRDYMKTLTGGIASDLRDAPSRYVGQVYEQAKAIEQAYNTWRMLQKQGKVQEAQEFRAANQDKLNRYRSIEHVKKAETSLNNRIRMIERSTSMDADQKREMIRRLNQNKERVAKMVA
ncbi:MAG: methyltransferase [Rhodoferax sp.]|nr:methyltransferase [Rhodoferax sp.]